MTCTSCGDEVEQVHPVRRKYVTNEPSDQEPSDQGPSERVIDEIEHWCFPCLTHYPHEPVE